MALGRSAISAARGEINNIRNKVHAVSDSRMQIKNLFQEENFQKFVRESAYGTSINDALNELIKFTGEDISGMIEGLCASTETFLAHQDYLNNQKLK